MNLIQKWFGKQAPAAAAVVDRIEIIEAERDTALARQAAAKAKLADLAVLSAEEHAAAENAEAEGRRAVERAEKQIADLRAEQAAAEAREAREAFDRDVVAHERAIAAWIASVEEKYPGAAETLADLCDRRVAIDEQTRKLERRGRDLRVPFRTPEPEAFRASPQRWKVRWPTPAGGRMTGSPENAPRGMIRWEGDTPVPAREGVTVEPRPLRRPAAFLDVIHHLPALHHGEPDYWHAPSAPAFFPAGPF